MIECRCNSNNLPVPFSVEVSNLKALISNLVSVCVTKSYTCHGKTFFHNWQDESDQFWYRMADCGHVVGELEILRAILTEPTAILQSSPSPPPTAVRSALQHCSAAAEAARNS